MRARTHQYGRAPVHVAFTCLSADASCCRPSVNRSLPSIHLSLSPYPPPPTPPSCKSICPPALHAPLLSTPHLLKNQPSLLLVSLPLLVKVASDPQDAHLLAPLVLYRPVSEHIRLNSPPLGVGKPRLVSNGGGRILV